MASDFVKLFKSGVFIAIFGGLIAFLFATIGLGTLFTGWMEGIFILIIVALAAYLLKYTDVDNMKVVMFFLLVGVIAGFGTILVGLAPFLAPYILSVQSFGSMSAWILTIFYILVGDAIADKIF